MIISDEQFLYLATFFLIYSFIGWIIDSASRTYTNKKLTSGGFLIGPFCPIYGLPCIIMAVIGNYIKGDVSLLFFGAVIILTSWEYAVAWCLETIFNKKFWDYSNDKYNYKGRICLQTSLSWGFLAVLFILVIHPLISSTIRKLPIELLFSIVSFLYLLLFVDLLISIAKHARSKYTLTTM